MRQLVIITPDAELAARIAACGGELATVATASAREGLELARSRGGSIVVVDANAQWTIDIVSMIESDPAIPLVVVTSDEKSDDILELLDRGARDHVVNDESLSRRLPIVLRRLRWDLEREARLAASERQLRESHALIQTFLDALPIGVFIVRGDGSPCFTNRTAAEMYGAGEGAKSHLSELVADVDVRREDGSPYPFQDLPLVHAMQGRRAHVDDIEVTLEGRPRPIEAWAVPIVDHDGRVLYAVSAFADVSARKAAEAEIRELNRSLRRTVAAQTGELVAAEGALRTTERRARALFEQSRHGMMFLSPLGSVIDANRAVRELVRGRVTGSSLHDIASALGEAPEPEALRTLLERCVGAGEAVQLDVVARDPGGALASHRRLHLQRVLDDQGVVEMVFCVCMDLTSLELAREELSHAWHLAEAASLAKSQFLASMTHEIRTPMNAILGFASILASDTTLPDEQRDAALTIRGAGESLLALLDQVLAMARVESGRAEVRPVVFSPAQLLSELKEQFGSGASRLGLHVEVAHGTSSLVRADVRLLRQILVQLVGNALKFTKHGQVTLRADIEHAHGGSALLVSVGDTGIGIPAEDLPRIFGAFEQGASVRRTIGGAGLGITIASKTAELLGGRLSVHSEPRQGSRFTVSIPVLEVEIDGVSSVPGPPDLDGIAASLARLDEGALDEMRQALRLGDVARLGQLSCRVPDEASATALRRLVDELAYDRLALLLA